MGERKAASRRRLRTERGAEALAKPRPAASKRGSGEHDEVTSNLSEPQCLRPSAQAGSETVTQITWNHYCWLKMQCVFQQLLLPHFSAWSTAAPTSLSRCG